MDVDVILDTRARPRELAELGQQAEAAGIGGVWVSSLLDSRDPFTNLAPLAQATARIRLGPIAVNPYDMHPVRIASSLLTLNELAGGRGRLVVGGGGEALEALGISPARRVRAVAEAVEIIRAAATGQRLDYTGELYEVHGLTLRWLESPPPAVFVGASQPQMLRMAARVADGVMLSDMPPGPASQAVATLDAALAARDRARPAFWTSVFTAWHVYADRRQALNEARRWLLLRGIFRPWLLAEFLDPADVERVMRAKPAFAKAFAAGSHEVEGVPDRLLDTLAENVAICGTPQGIESAITKLRELAAAGLGGVALRLYAQPAESIRLLGQRIVPALAG